VAYLATRADVPIVPVGLTGTEQIKRNLPRLRRTHVRVVVGEPFRLPESGEVRGQKLREYTDLNMPIRAAPAPSLALGVGSVKVRRARWPPRQSFTWEARTVVRYEHLAISR